MYPKKEIKKKLKSFLLKEDGQISKETILRTAVVTSSIALGATMAADQVAAGHNSHGNHGSNAHVNSINLNTAPVTTAAGSHAHTPHSSHASHSSAEFDCCFPAGTMISTPKGDIEIEKIEIGATILSFNENKRKIEASKVL